jgi:hypothetical protein
LNGLIVSPLRLNTAVPSATALFNAGMPHQDAEPFAASQMMFALDRSCGNPRCG